MKKRKYRIGPCAQARKDEAKDLYVNQKLSCTEVGKRLGMTRQGAWDVLHRSGVKLRNQGTQTHYITIPRSEFVKACCKNEYTRAQAAAVLNMCPSYMIERLKGLKLVGKFKTPPRPSGSSSARWKGNAANYAAKQHRALKALGKPKFCAVCNAHDKKRGYIWHRKSSGNAMKDFVPLCRSCNAKLRFVKPAQRRMMMKKIKSFVRVEVQK